jgi:hypothetical protein
MASRTEKGGMDASRELCFENMLYFKEFTGR